MSVYKTDLRKCTIIVFVYLSAYCSITEKFAKQENALAIAVTTAGF